MVVPHRPAVLSAKVLSTIDYLSKGRLTLGIGVGWCREEFEAIGAAPFDDRGAVTDEWMAACQELWSAEAPKFDGKYVRFDDVVFTPKPVQKPIPIWVGGESAPGVLVGGFIVLLCCGAITRAEEERCGTASGRPAPSHAAAGAGRRFRRAPHGSGGR